MTRPLKVLITIEIEELNKVMQNSNMQLDIKNKGIKINELYLKIVIIKVAIL